MNFNVEIPLLARRAAYRGGRKARSARRRLAAHPVTLYFGTVNAALDACENVNKALRMEDHTLTTEARLLVNVLGIEWKFDQADLIRTWEVDRAVTGSFTLK